MSTGLVTHSVVSTMTTLVTAGSVVAINTVYKTKQINAHLNELAVSLISLLSFLLV